MRMLDVDAKRRVRELQLYLSADEAAELRDRLAELLADPEAPEHRYVFSRDLGAALSVSVVTERKLAGGRYTTVERELLTSR